MLAVAERTSDLEQLPRRRMETYGTALVLGRGVHAPWNEGRRLITRQFAQVVGHVRPVRTLSLTNETFRDAITTDDSISHIYSRMGYSALGDYAALPAIIRAVGNILEREQVEVAHLIGVPLMIAPWLRQQGVRVVSHVSLTRQVYQNTVERLRANLGWRAFDPWIDAYACNGSQVRADLLNQGHERHKLHLVPPMIDSQLFQPMSQQTAREALRLPDDAFVVSYVGTVSPLRFPASEIIRALQLAAPAIPNLRLEVMVPVATHAYNLAWANNNVDQAARGSAVPISIHLRDLTEAEKVLVYNAADVVLLPFGAPVAVEPPLTLLEAMSCARPVAAAPYANRSGIVANRSNGLSYESAEQLAAQLVWLAQQSPAQRAELAARARADVISQHSFAAVAAATQQMWDAIGLRRAPGELPVKEIG